MMLPPDWIKEKLLKPAGLPQELLDELTPDMMAGVRGNLPLYDKFAVEKLIERNRPSLVNTKSFSKVQEDFNVVDFNASAQPFERIADSLEQLVAVLVPKQEPERAAGPRMLTPAEAAQKMRVNVQTVREWCREGRLGVRTGSRWLINPDEVKQYLRGQSLIKGKVAG